MSTTHYIALDVHCTSTEMAVVTSSGRVSKRGRFPTTIPNLLEAVCGVRRPRRVTFEEGPLADWLKRNLRHHAEEVVVCEPRRNRLIANESDKDDRIDAEKLAQLYRGGYLKVVHHPESFGRSVFKQHVTLYHDAVRERVRLANRIMAQFRHQGIFLAETAFRAEEDRGALLDRLPPSKLLREDLRWLWHSYDAAAEREAAGEKELARRARRIEPIGRFVKLPGIRWIRAATFYVYVDTPWRFQGKSALWKYLGIGLERKQSGQGRERLRVAQCVNRRLKEMILGAATTAIAQKDNPFACQFHNWLIEGGLSPQNARRNVARSIAGTLWGMWKNGTAYEPKWVGQGF